MAGTSVLIFPSATSYDGGEKVERRRTPGQGRLFGSWTSAPLIATGWQMYLMLTDALYAVVKKGKKTLLSCSHSPSKQPPHSELYDPRNYLVRGGQRAYEHKIIQLNKSAIHVSYMHRISHMSASTSPTPE